MKVKIIKAEKPTYWYASKVGEVFEVEVSNFDSDFRLATKQHLFISAKDCEVVNTLQELEAAKNLVAELEKKVAEEAAIEAAKPFTKEQYEKVVAEYRACAGRKKFELNTNHYVLNICGNGKVGCDNWMETMSVAPFGVFFNTHANIQAAIAKVGANNLRKAYEYEMNIGLEGK